MQNQFGSVDLDRLNDAVRRRRRRASPARLAHRLMVGAVDADFAAAVNLVDARARLEQDGVAVRAAAGRVAVRHGPRQVLRQVQVQVAAAGRR